MSDDVPDWGERWMAGSCGCGGRLVYVGCYCGGHTACARSAQNIEICPLRADAVPTERGTR